jgi:hypothetical protein
MWLANQYIPMQPPFKTILNVIVILMVCLWLLSAFGIISSLNVPAK